MPTVPTSFVPQVGTSGETGNVQFVAPGIAPMENLAAQQQIELGRATQGLGQTVWRVGQIMEDDYNTAKAKSAEGAALDAMDGILNGENGYMFAQGQDAQARFGATEAAIAERVQGAMQGLDNDVQKAMFQQSVSRAMGNARVRMNTHRNNEVTKWKAQESSRRAKRYVGQAINAFESRDDMSVDAAGNPTGEFATNVRVALEEARKAGRLAGYPEDSEAMAGLQRDVMDDVASGVVGRLIDRTDYNGAMAYLGTVKGQINPETHERLLGIAYSGQRKAGVDELTRNIMNFGRVESVALTRPYVTPVPGGNMMSAKPGVGLEEGQDQGTVITAEPDTPVHAPYDGKVTHMETDSTGMSLRIQLDDGRVAIMRGLSPNSEAAGGLYAGKAISRNSVIGLMGNGSMQYMLEENGEPVDVMDVNSVSTQAVGAEPRPPKTLEEALAMANLTKPDVADVKAVRATIRQRWAEREDAQKASYEQLVMQVDRIISEPGNDWKSVPDGLWGQLSPADQEARLKPWREQNDLTVAEEYARSPGAFPVDRVMRLRDSLTRDTYTRMLNAASSASNQSAQVDAQAINATLINNKMDSLAFPKGDKDKAASLLLRQRIEETLRDARQRGPVDDRMRQQIIDDAVMTFGSRDDRSWIEWLIRSGTQVKEAPIAGMTAEDRELMRTGGVVTRNIQGTQIPFKRYEQIVNDLIRRGEEPTNQRVLDTFKAKR